ncbi:MAG: 50S ribosomal protein L9 [Bacteroidales bacterium]|nr:50S ribosomal protein L9 [Candidatus Cryptobacteroides faecihippi]
MKIILKKEVANLGEAGDVVEVKAGYAQNYLIPQGYAIAATVSALKMREETIRQRAHKEAKLVADAEALAAKIAATPVKVAVKVSETGKIYGSVTSAQLAEALQAVGIEADKKNITLPEVAGLGEYEAVVKCYKAVKAALKFEVVAE